MNKANKTPPALITTLPALAGFVDTNNGYGNYYCKTQEGIVYFSFHLKRADGGLIAGNTSVLAFPSGYRPGKHMTFPAITRNATNSVVQACSVTTNSGGNTWTTYMKAVDLANTHTIEFSGSFRAAP